AAGRTGRSDRAWPRTTSDIEALAAATFAAHVGVVELEAFVEPFPSEIQLGAIKVNQAFRVDDDAYAMALEHLVLRLQLVDKLQHIGQTGTARGTHAQTNTFAFAATFQGATHMLCSRFSHADCHDALLRADPSCACSRARPP